MTMQTVLICTAAAEQVLPCPAGSAPSFINAYLLDEIAATSLVNNMQPADWVSSSQLGLAVYAAVLVFYASLLVFKIALRSIRRF